MKKGESKDKHQLVNRVHRKKVKSSDGNDDNKSAKTPILNVLQSFAAKSLVDCYSGSSAASKGHVEGAVKDHGEHEGKETGSKTDCTSVAMPEDGKERMGEREEVGENSVYEKREKQGQISTGKMSGKESSLKGLVTSVDNESSSAARGHAGNAKKRKEHENSLGIRRSQSAWLCDDPSEDEDSDWQTSEDDEDSDCQTSEDEDSDWRMNGVKNKKSRGGYPKKKRTSVRAKRKDRSSHLMKIQQNREEEGDDDSDWQPTEREINKDGERLQIRRSA
ncbi:uncharacterized protein [Amphiura filiformis]|uniref:uncharacterized protein isoform X2 n=1 Tax=Amphiura filiformis TaxID=82378 RepID=UPI003B2224EA